MRWPRRRRDQPGPRHGWSPPDRIPDGDQVCGPGQRHWRELIDTTQVTEADLPVTDARDLEWLAEPTRALPTIRPGPLPMTLGQWWRSRGGGS